MGTWVIAFLPTGAGVEAKAVAIEAGARAVAAGAGALAGEGETPEEGEVAGGGEETQQLHLK